MKNPKVELNSLAEKFGVAQMSQRVLDDDRFFEWSGSSKLAQHHYGHGGLARHTLEVVELCLLNNSYFPDSKKVNESKLFLAALFHDVGKIYDYRFRPEMKLELGYWEGTRHKRMVHHISRSAIIWSQAAKDWNYPDADDEILHAILAHHGFREWGSPVAPVTRMAWLLHLCDGISARIDDCDKFYRIN